MQTIPIYINITKLSYSIMTNMAGALLPALVFGTSIAYADESKKIEEETIVWGTAVKSSSVYMGADDLQLKQADHLSDLLRIIPGVDVGGAHSLNQRITIRSVEDRDIRITIDGASQNNYMYHHMGNLQIHADILKAVDIDVGTNSVVHGGLGGSVRFETKTAAELLGAEQKFGGIVKVAASTNASDDVSVSLFGESGDFDLLAYYNRVEKKNFKVGGGEITDADGNEIEGTDGKVKGLEGTVDSALLKAGWNLSSDHRIEAGYEFYKDAGDYSYRPDMGLATDIAISDGTGTPLLWPTEYTRDTFTLNYDGSIAGSTIKATVFENSSQLFRDEGGYAESSVPRFQAWAGRVKGAADNNGVTFMIDTEVSLGVEHNFTYGAEFLNYDTHYQAQYDSGESDSSGEKKSDQSLYLQDRIVINDMFSITPGVRHDSIDVNSTLVNNTFSETSFALAGELQAHEALVFRASTTELFQAPEIAEVFVGAGLFDQPNPDIKAETGRNSELAVAFGDDVLGADQFTAGATIFNTQIDNYIYDYAPKDNVGDMSITGYEAYVGYSIGRVDALLTYSSNDSELSAFEEYSDYDGARMDRIQGDTLSFKFDYAMPRFNTNIHWDFLVVADVDAVIGDQQLDGASTDNKKPGYQVHNLSARWQPNNHISLIFGIDNVFDEYYVNQSSRTGSSFHPVFGSLYLNDYEPGRNIKTTLSVQF